MAQHVRQVAWPLTTVAPAEAATVAMTDYRRLA
ncbi:hypothetical protein GGE67_006119 [Rhizobium leucaenae]|nr:hypothetical protein [Rhizobium leucaenae]